LPRVANRAFGLIRAPIGSRREKAEVDAEIRHDNRAYDNELERQRAFERRNWRKSAMQNENGTAMHWEQYTPKNVKGMTLREEGGVEEVSLAVVVSTQPVVFAHSVPTGQRHSERRPQ